MFQREKGPILKIGLLGTFKKFCFEKSPAFKAGLLNEERKNYSSIISGSSSNVFL